MARPKKIKFIIISFTFFLFLILENIWPTPLDNSPLDSLKIYGKYILGKDTQASEILGVVDIACAIGPYDSFMDIRLSKKLSNEQAVAAEDILETWNKKSLGDNQFFLVGFRGKKLRPSMSQISFPIYLQ